MQTLIPFLEATYERGSGHGSVHERVVHNVSQVCWQRLISLPFRTGKRFAVSPSLHWQETSSASPLLFNI